MKRRKEFPNIREILVQWTILLYIWKIYESGYFRNDKSETFFVAESARIFQISPWWEKRLLLQFSKTDL